MKQKIVIKVQMACDKCRSKAMGLVAATGGVDSVALAGEGKDQVVVVGDGVDSVKLTSALCKKVGPAQLVQVGDAKKEEEKQVGDAKKEEEKKKPAAVVEFRHPWHYYQYAPQPASVVYQHHAAAYAYQYDSHSDTIVISEATSPKAESSLLNSDGRRRAKS